MQSNITNTTIWSKLKKQENNILGVILYIVALVYIYQYYKSPDKYAITSPDEVFYYIEAKAIAAHNSYQTPLSLDGNTSLIGDFGSHGISYALKDGWLSKLLFQPNDPPLIFINLLTCLVVLSLILSFKTLSVNIRLKIALIVATHYILFWYSLSYMQETIQFLFAILALRGLYIIYQNPANISKKHLYQYIAIIAIAITFRYGWFIWGLGLLPLSQNSRTFIKHSLIVLGLFVFALFIGKYIYAPYPYEEITAFKLIRSNSLSLIDSTQLIWDGLINNLQLYFTPTKNTITSLMRYLLLILLITNTIYAIIKKNKFTIACTLIAWTYFVICMAFYFLTWQADERILAILHPLLAFSLITINSSILLYPLVVIHLILFPLAIDTRISNYKSLIDVETYTANRISQEASYSKIAQLITDDKDVVISITPMIVWHGNPNYITQLPLKTNKGYSIHYRQYINASDLRKKHKAMYSITQEPILEGGFQLIYSDKWIFFYKNLN
ncbi:MAG: hypothetical protein WBM13_02520 [Bacteroidia bacterium]